MKAMDKLVEGKEELMFRGEKATGISSFLHLSVVGVRQHLPVPPNSAACVCVNCASRRLCLFSSM